MANKLEQPDDSSRDEVVFALMIERGLADSDEGWTISCEEMEELISSWSS
ncbi:MAG TPA: hypothetical protein VE078_04200 [Thermoanaerobaculia bacterium]|nr:hypothetical protein [Thermoanaerobaculia bacterium]